MPYQLHVRGIARVLDGGSACRYNETVGDGDVAVDVQVLDQRLTMKYHLSKVRLREFVWVGGHVTVAVGWASGPNVLVSRGQGPSMSGDLWPRPVVRAVARGRRSVHRSAKTAPRDRFGALVYTVATRRSRERLRGGAGVYTDRQKRPLGTVLGHAHHPDKRIHAINFSQNSLGCRVKNSA